MSWDSRRKKSSLIQYQTLQQNAIKSSEYSAYCFCFETKMQIVVASSGGEQMKTNGGDGYTINEYEISVEFLIFSG